MNDNSTMPFGLHRGKKLANVPAEYLRWLYDNGKLYGELKTYVEENLDVIKAEINYSDKSKNEKP
ncbi:MAG: hypothetical protein UT21_C0006G0015 [Candidatus Woesebacteria bacterium GW2011_GWA1_39_11b]|nr:MAG: hypothetical protein UT21_C0006G0015 [Candidatus Woesebacteria bacterium GW2011_GWA1_39_11b]